MNEKLHKLLARFLREDWYSEDECISDIKAVFREMFEQPSDRIEFPITKEVWEKFRAEILAKLEN